MTEETTELLSATTDLNELNKMVGVCWQGADGDECHFVLSCWVPSSEFSETAPNYDLPGTDSRVDVLNVSTGGSTLYTAKVRLGMTLRQLQVKLPLGALRRVVREMVSHVRGQGEGLGAFATVRMAFSQSEARFDCEGQTWTLPARVIKCQDT